MVVQTELSRLDIEDTAARLRLDQRSLVLELGCASTDGLLAAFAVRGIRTMRIASFDAFDQDAARRLRQEHGRANLIITTSDLAYAANLDAVVAGIPLLLAWNGTLAVDLAYGFALETVEALLERHALRAYDVDLSSMPEWPERVWACHSAEVRRRTPLLRQLTAN